MIIQSLVQYYDILSQGEEKKLPKFGYSIANVSYVLQISQKGELVHIIEYKTNDAKPKPRSILVPKQSSRSGSGCNPFFLCDNAINVFGIEVIKNNDFKKKNKDIDFILEKLNDDYLVVTKRSRKCFESFRSYHHNVLDSVDSVETSAFLTFLDSWNPSDFLKNPKIVEYKDDLISGVWIIFEVSGKFLHDITTIQRIWEEKYNDSIDENPFYAQCLVNGKIQPVSRVHQKIKGVLGTKGAGAPLVSFNKKAFESYCKEQSFNAPIGISSEFKYSTVLNHLVANKKNTLYLANNTVVFWAETSDNAYEDLTLSLINPPDNHEDSSNKNVKNQDSKIKDKKTIQLIQDIIRKVKKLERIDQTITGIHPETQFYILGLSPNSGRIAVRFWYQNTYEEFVKRIGQHHLDLEIVKADFEPSFLSIFKLLRETVPKGVEKGEPSPILGGLILNAVLNGTQYPIQMYYAILNRVRVDKSINFARAAFIKAYLLRLSRNGATSLQEDMITMSLNEESPNIPYRLGRLFAVLERVQRDTNKEMGSTIKNKYFSSASATPSVVFPVLLKLAQYHIAKSDWGFIVDRDIQEILSGVKTFPIFLTLEEQGMFMLGFYHQKQAFFTKKST